MNLLGHESSLKRILEDPDEVRVEGHETLQSGIVNPGYDPNHLYFYGTVDKAQVLLSLVRRTNGEGFLITAFKPTSTDLVEGDVIYRRGAVPWLL